MGNFFEKSICDEKEHEFNSHRKFESFSADIILKTIPAKSQESGSKTTIKKISPLMKKESQYPKNILLPATQWKVSNGERELTPVEKLDLSLIEAIMKDKSYQFV
jgi:hypothetical protein